MGEKNRMTPTTARSSVIAGLLGSGASLAEPSTWVAPELLRVSTPEEILTLVEELCSYAVAGDANRIPVNALLEPVIKFYQEKMALLQLTLQSAYDECGGAGDGLDLNEFRIVLEVLQCGIDVRAVTKIFKQMNAEARDGDDENILSGETFATMCVRHDVFPKTSVARELAHAPLNLSQALRRRGVAKKRRTATR